MHVWTADNKFINKSLHKHQLLFYYAPIPGLIQFQTNFPYTKKCIQYTAFLGEMSGVFIYGRAIIYLAQKNCGLYANHDNLHELLNSKLVQLQYTSRPQYIFSVLRIFVSFNNEN